MPRKWSREDLQILIIHVVRGTSKEEKAKILGRSVEAVSSKARPLYQIKLALEETLKRIVLEEEDLTLLDELYHNLQNFNVTYVS